jgi:Flp pilus assembly protein TadG
MGNCRTHRATKRVYKARRAFLGNASCRGQALPEFALVAMTFFLLAFALIDFSWLMFNQMNMQDAVREAGRYASTGNHYVPDPINAPGVTLNRVDSIKQILNQAAAGANCVPVVSNSSGAVDGTGLPNAGLPSDTVTITANCAIPLLTTAIGSFFGTDNKYHFAVSSTFKNEPFSPTQTN